MQNGFLMPSRLKSNIILVLGRLQCVAWVNCLVLTIQLILEQNYIEIMHEVVADKIVINVTHKSCR